MGLQELLDELFPNKSHERHDFGPLVDILESWIAKNRFHSLMALQRILRGVKVNENEKKQIYGLLFPGPSKITIGSDLETRLFRLLLEKSPHLVVKFYSDEPIIYENWFSKHPETLEKVLEDHSYFEPFSQFLLANRNRVWDEGVKYKPGKQSMSPARIIYQTEKLHSVIDVRGTLDYLHGRNLLMDFWVSHFWKGAVENGRIVDFDHDEYFISILKKSAQKHPESIRQLLLTFLHPIEFHKFINIHGIILSFPLELTCIFRKIKPFQTLESALFSHLKTQPSITVLAALLITDNERSFFISSLLENPETKYKIQEQLDRISVSRDLGETSSQDWDKLFSLLIHTFIVHFKLTASLKNPLQVEKYFQFLGIDLKCSKSPSTCPKKLKLSENCSEPPSCIRQSTIVLPKHVSALEIIQKKKTPTSNIKDPTNSITLLFTEIPHYVSSLFILNFLKFEKT